MCREQAQFLRKICSTFKTGILFGFGILLVYQLDVVTEKHLLKPCCSYSTSVYAKKSTTNLSLPLVIFKELQ